MRNLNRFIVEGGLKEENTVDLGKYSNDLMKLSLVALFLLLWNIIVFQNAAMQKRISQQIIPNISQTPSTETDLLNWKTYKNEKYGFELKYPHDWIANSMDSTKTLENTDSVNFRPASDQTPAESGFSIITIEDPNNLLVSQICKSKKQEEILCGQNIISSAKTINNISWEFLANGSASFPPTGYINYDKSLNGILYLVQNYSANLNDLNQFLSTFEFIDSAEITPTCRPRPACLDATPRCLIPETEDMCPKSSNAKSTSIETFFDGVYTNTKMHFSIAPPAGWIMKDGILESYNPEGDTKYSLENDYTKCDFYLVKDDGTIYSSINTAGTIKTENPKITAQEVVWTDGPMANTIIHSYLFEQQNYDGIRAVCYFLAPQTFYKLEASISTFKFTN